jgi:hypothetical protein
MRCNNFQIFFDKNCVISPQMMPVEVIRIIGQYAVTSLEDWESLSGAGWRDALTYPRALSLVRLHVPHLPSMFQSVPNSVLSGVRELAVDDCGDLSRLVAATPKLHTIDLGSCDGLRSTEALDQLKELRAVSMQLCTACSPFSGQLEHLDLKGCSPIGGDLSDLRSLKLRGCVIHNITHMNQALLSLDLHSTRWSFCKPSSLGGDGWTLRQLHELTSLQVLKLTNCDTLRNASGIAGMKDLHTLCLIDCVSVNDFSFLKELPRLRALGAPLSFDWSMLQYLNLESFEVRSNAENLHRLSSQTELKSLSVRWWSQFWSPDPSLELFDVLQCLPDLHTLDLSQWKTIHDLPLCPSVRRLVVDHCLCLRDEQLQTLVQSFPHLELLSMARTGITDKGLGMLNPLLQHLNIRNTAVTDKGLRSLHKMGNLLSLNIVDCRLTPGLIPSSVKLLGLHDPGAMDFESWSSLRHRGVQVVSSKTFIARIGVGL